MNRITSFVSLAAVAALAVAPGTAGAGPLPLPTQPVAPLEYAVKIVCGRNPAVQPPPPLLASGIYYTIVNIHNPNKIAEFTWKVSLADVEKPGAMTPFKPFMALKYDQSMDLDCTSVQKWFAANGIPMPPALFTGFLVIQSHQELDVVAVYTAAGSGPAGFQVTSLHTERVAFRKVP